MTPGRTAAALLDSRLADALAVWSGEVRTTGEISRREIAILHDLFDTVAGEVRSALADPVTAAAADPAPALSALAAGLAELSADISHFQQWSRGLQDHDARSQAACVARRADAYGELVQDLGGRGLSAGRRTGRGVSPLPGADPGRDRGPGIRPAVVLRAAARRRGGGGVHPGASAGGRTRTEPREMSE